MTNKTSKYDRFRIIPFLNIIFVVSLFLGLTLLVTGFVFFISSLNCNYCSCCAPSFYDISMFLITIGIGLFTIAFSVKQHTNHLSRLGEEYRIQTNNVFKLYTETLATDDYLFIEKVIGDVFVKYSSDFKELIENFINNEYDTSNFFGKFYQINEEKIKIEIYEICFSRLNYLRLENQEINSKLLIDIFESRFRKVMFSFEDICQRFMQMNINEDVFKNSIYPTISDLFLSSLYFIYFFGLEEDLLNMTYCILELEKEYGDFYGKKNN